MYLSPLNFIQNEINLAIISNWPGLQQIDVGWKNWLRLKQIGLDRKQIDLGWNKLA